MRPETILAIAALAAGPLSLPPSAFAQRLSIGVVAGTNLTDDFRTITFPPDFRNSSLAYSDSRSPIIGPAVELGLARHLSVEVDALHRALHFTDVTVLANGSRVDPRPAAAGTWEFPLLVKYSLGVSRVRPFLELGPSFRAVSNPNGSNPSNHGISAGAGAEMRVGNLRLAPAVRYTRWATDHFRPEQTGGFNSPARPTIRNQVEFLVGVSYATTGASRRALGRKLWLGAVAGVSLTGDFGGQSSSRGYPAGLMVELELPRHLAVEADGLYRRLHFSGRPDVVLTWEVPLLLKYRFTTPHVTPFLALGPSFRVTGNLNDSNPSHYGIAAGAGVETRLGRLKVAPTIRYTRWAGDSRPFPQFPNIPYSRSIPNQAEALVGFFF